MRIHSLILLLLVNIAAHSAVVNLFDFGGTVPANAGNLQPLITFAGGTPSGTFAVSSLDFGANWHPADPYGD